MCELAAAFITDIQSTAAIMIRLTHDKIPTVSQ